MADVLGLTMGELDGLQIPTRLAERRLTRRRAAARLVYGDDATSRLLELGFAVFHVQARDRAQGGTRLSQFDRACQALNIDLLCANSPEAKGRVGRAIGTLQAEAAAARRPPAADSRRAPTVKADISTWGKGGHFYLVFTGTHRGWPPAAAAQLAPAPAAATSAGILVRKNSRTDALGDSLRIA